MTDIPKISGDMKTVTFDETKYALVPKEPTDEMLKAGVKAFQHAWVGKDMLGDWRAAYKAEIAAAEAPKENK